MLLTSQRFTAGQQAVNARPLPMFPVAVFVINWPSVSIRSSVVGTHCGRYGLPGIVGESIYGGSKPSDGTSAQNHVIMKNIRKQTGITASDKARVSLPVLTDNPQDLVLFDNQVFAEKPAPRQPESPDVESLRSLLKANISREKASPALLQRIRIRAQEHKE